MTVCELWRDEKRVYSPTKAHAAATSFPGSCSTLPLSRSGERVTWCSRSTLQSNTRDIGSEMRHIFLIGSRFSKKIGPNSRIVRAPYIPCPLQTLYNLFSPASHAWNKVLSPEFLRLNKMHIAFLLLYIGPSLWHMSKIERSRVSLRSCYSIKQVVTVGRESQARILKVSFSESWTAIKPAVEAIRNYDLHMWNSRTLNCCFFYFAILRLLQKNK